MNIVELPTIQKIVGYICMTCEIQTKCTELSLCPRRFHRMSPIVRQVPIKERKYHV